MAVANSFAADELTYLPDSSGSDQLCFHFERGVCMQFIISFVVFQCCPPVDATFVTWSRVTVLLYTIPRCLLSQLFSINRAVPDCEITLLFRDVFFFFFYSSSRSFLFLMSVHLWLRAYFIPSITIRFSVRQSPRLRVLYPSQLVCCESLGRMRQIPWCKGRMDPAIRIAYRLPRQCHPRRHAHQQRPKLC